MEENKQTQITCSDYVDLEERWLEHGKPQRAAMQARRRKHKGKSSRRSYGLGAPGNRNTIQIVEGGGDSVQMLVETAFSVRHPRPHNVRHVQPASRGERDNRGLYGAEHLVPEVSYSVNRKGRWTIDEQLARLQQTRGQSDLGVYKEREHVKGKLGVPTKLTTFSVAVPATPPGREAELKAGRRGRAAARARQRRKQHSQQRTPDATSSLLQPQWQYRDAKTARFTDFGERDNRQIEQHWRSVEAGIADGCLFLHRSGNGYWGQQTSSVFDCKSLLRVDTCFTMAYSPTTYKETLTIKTQTAVPIQRVLVRADDPNRGVTMRLVKSRRGLVTKAVREKGGKRGARARASSGTCGTQVGPAPAGTCVLACVKRVSSRDTGKAQVASRWRRRSPERGRALKRLRTVEEQTVDHRVKLR